MAAYLLAFLLYALQSSPYVVMGWMSHRGKPLELLFAVMAWGALVLGAVVVPRMLLASLRRSKGAAPAGKVPLAGLLIHSALSAATWILLFHVMSAAGPVLTVSATLVSSILTVPIGMLLLKTKKHSADAGKTAVLAISLMLLAALQIVKARAGVSTVEASALSAPGTLITILAWTSLSALASVVKVRITDAHEASARTHRALPPSTVIFTEVTVTAALCCGILAINDGFEAVGAFFGSSLWPSQWPADAFWIIYLATAPTALGLVTQTKLSNKIGTPASAGLSQTRPLIADVMQAAAGISVFSAAVASDMFTAAVLGGIAARLLAKR